jgi:small subunit ribosomal protein S14
MANKSWIERDKKRRELVKKYSALRAELMAKRDYAGLSKIPRNASPVRVVNRCKISGRRHGFLRKFGCSRLTFRELAMASLLPGVTKASW